MSNKPKRTRVCAEPGCLKSADVKAMSFDDDGTDRGSRWLCRRHAVKFARGFEGKLWGDSQCSCGCVDHIYHEAGRTKQGDL